MKNYCCPLLIIIGLLFAQCSHTAPEVVPMIDYKNKSITLMEKLAPQLVGKWQFRQVVVNYQTHKSIQGNRLGLSKDTVFRDLATLEIYPAAKLRILPVQPEHPQFEGTLQFRGKTYPVYFYLLAGPRVMTQQGPHATFFFTYNFSEPMRIPEKEEILLETIGLMGENFSLEMHPRRQHMFWKGYNRGISEILLQKL